MIDSLERKLLDIYPESEVKFPDGSTYKYREILAYSKNMELSGNTTKKVGDFHLLKARKDISFISRLVFLITRRIPFAVIDENICPEREKEIVCDLETFSRSNKCTEVLSQVAIIVYTSGSTGVPKGIVLSGQNINDACRGISERLEYSREDRVAVISPLSFDYGLYQLFLCIECGADVVLVDPERFSIEPLHCIRNEKITILPLVPSMWSMLRLSIDRYRSRGQDFTGRLKKITFTGERLPKTTLLEVVGRLPHVKIYKMYGLTECKRVSILDHSEIGSFGDTSGTAISCCKVVVKTAGGEFKDTGTGELIVVGSNVCLCMTNQNEDIFILDGQRALRTHDEGHVLPSGHIVVLGRNDTVIKINGVRVSTLEIENAIEKIDSVDAVRVDCSGEEVKLYITYSPQSTKEEILAEIPRYIELKKLPKNIVFSPSANTNSRGKLLIEL